MCVRQRHDSRRRTCLLILIFSAAVSTAAQNRDEVSPSDEQLQAAFLKKSSRELLNQYFQAPPYPLFVIRRLIDLADPLVIPDLERAFARETRHLNQLFLAAALLRLGDHKPEFFDYVASHATAAAESDLPFPVHLENRRLSGAVLPPFTSTFKAWVRKHQIPIDSAMQQSVFDFPASVVALGEAADVRSRPILVRALNSPNVLVVFEAALGLARLQDEPASVAIIAAARRTWSSTERQTIAKSLLYFANSKAQVDAARLINDPALRQRWRKEVNRRGWRRAMDDRGY